MRRLFGGIVVGIGAFFALASPALAVTGSQSLTLFGQGDETTIVGSGPISGVGHSITTGEATETDVFPSGSVNISHPQTGGSDSFNPLTCFGTATFTGTYQITSGTGAYTGASGSGTYQGRSFFLGQRTADGCSEDGGFNFFYVNASGTTTLP